MSWAVVPKQGLFHHPRDTWPRLEIFWIVLLEWGIGAATRVQWVEARDATQHPPLPGTAPVAAVLRPRNRVLAERQEGRCDRRLTCTGWGRKTRSQGLGRGKTTCGCLIRRRECECRSTYNGQSLDGLHLIYIHKSHSRDAASLLPPFLSPLLCLAPLPTPVSLGPSLMPSAGLGTKCHLVMCFVKGCLNFIQTDNVTEMTPFSLPLQEHSMLLTHFVCSTIFSWAQVLSLFLLF